MWLSAAKVSTWQTPSGCRGKRDDYCEDTRNDTDDDNCEDDDTDDTDDIDDCDNNCDGAIPGVR